MATNVFLDSRRVCSDDCAKEARDNQNESMFGYSVYQHLPVACKDPNARVPSFMYDHVNLRGRPGYGLSDGCLIDRSSGLRNDPTSLTRDRCRVQLSSRIFHAGPNLKPGVPNPDVEMPIQQGSSSGDLDGIKFPCKRAIMETLTNVPTPLLPCMKDIRNPNNIVEPWTRGGVDSRDYMLRQQIINDCRINRVTTGKTA